MVEKIARVRSMIGSRPIHLEVDGGVTPDTAALCAKAGANVLVAGSAVFKDGKYADNIAAIRAAAALLTIRRHRSICTCALSKLGQPRPPAHCRPCR